MTIWSARNGYQGMGRVAALVEADDEDEARRLATAALRADEEDYAAALRREPRTDYWGNLEVVPVGLPYVGDELP